MPTRTSTSGSELFIVDNSNEDWKVVRYLHDWCQISKSIDIATGFFEIGSLLGLKDEWQRVDQIRLLMGDEVSLRTRNAFAEGLGRLARRLDGSLESEKLKDDFLTGVPAIVEAIRSGKILCRVFRKEKFHAKAYITHARMEVVGSSALVGSSNFTFPGITENIELNVQITGRPVNVLQEWFEEHWDNAEDVIPEILRVIERHTQDFTPFEVYAKALFEYYAGHEMTVGEWEEQESKIYKILDQYQKEGYRALMKIAERHQGAFLCDGVGLGKTYIGLMLIERLLRDGQNVALIVPKSTRESVWEAELRRLLPDAYGDYSHLTVYNHTDLLRPGEWEDKIAKIGRVVNAIVIDEAHHFRNQAAARYKKVFEITGSAPPKQVFLLTATPINNRLLDLQHLIEIFSRSESGYFKDLGIHSLPGHFRKLEKALEKILNGDSYDAGGVTLQEAEEVLSDDHLFRSLVVQRSRSYVKKSQEQLRAREILFPERQDPEVVPYSITKTYGGLLDQIEKTMRRKHPLLTLAPYYPLAYAKEKEEVDPEDANRQKQIVGLIRTQFLKRFESSAPAFISTCETLLRRLLAFVEKHNSRDSERWKASHSESFARIQAHYAQRELEAGREPEEDQLLEELMEDIEPLDPTEYDVGRITKETLFDLEFLVQFLDELKDFSPKSDDKLRALTALLKKNRTLKDAKVLIFSEYMDTARYLARELEAAGIGPVQGVHSATKRDRADIVRAFAPYYNRLSSAQLAEKGVEEMRVVVSTDVLAEGLNLQDASCVINYDIHWNPVRLMQRIGRVDRRLDKATENRILRDHPETQRLRGKVWIWNFLPPDDLDRLLRLYANISKKTLRISKVFGIEGRKLMKPEDDYAALKDFNHDYEGVISSTESMFLTWQKLLKSHPNIEEQLKDLPLRVFSGKDHPTENANAVFFCYTVPVHLAEQDRWTTDEGNCRWYLYDLDSKAIADAPTAMLPLIQSTPKTPRRLRMERPTLTEIRLEIEKHIKNTYLKSVQAPVGVAPVLKAWMELS